MNPLKSLEVILVVYAQYYHVYTMVDFSVRGEQIHFPQEKCPIPTWYIFLISVAMDTRLCLPSYIRHTTITTIGQIRMA